MIKKPMVTQKRPKALYLIILLISLSLACGSLPGGDPSGEIVDLSAATPTRTPQPTFTPTSQPTVVIIPTNTPLPTATPIPPTDTPTPEPAPEEVLAEEPTSEPTAPPQAQITTNLNVRGGPGTNYNRIGSVNQGTTVSVTGRNAAGDWLAIDYEGQQGWVAGNFATVAGDVNALAVVEAPAPPPQAAAPPPSNPQPAPQPQPEAPAPPPAPEQPQYKYSIVNVFGQKNEAITQIRGYIGEAGRSDVGVNGVRVRVRSGSFCTVSVPSGTAGVYPAGNYDVLLDTRAKPGDWQIAIVDKPTDPTDNRCDPGAALLSEEISVPTDTTNGVVFVEFARNF